jgi:diadenosine tetraphosphate (Ap4A) HIT family hydrolase
MLMMVDPHVHWHVLPRYEGTRDGPGLAIEDTGWPRLPQLAGAVSLAPAEIATLGEWLRSKWPAPG